MPQLAAAIPYIVIATTVASTAVSATAAIQEGQARKKAADYQAKELAQQAQQAQQQAALQVAAQDERAVAILSSIRASAAASGVDVSSGSPLQAYQSSSEQAQLNDMYLKYAGNLQATGLQSQAALTTWGGKRAATAGYLTGAGDVISGAGSLARFGLEYSRLGSNPPVIQ